MLDRTQEVTGAMLIQISTDAGYTSLLDLQECQERNVRLVAPVQENTFTEQKRAQAGPASHRRPDSNGFPKSRRIAVLRDTD